LPSGKLPLNKKSQAPSGELGTEDLSLSILRMRSTRSAFPFKFGWLQYVCLITIDNPEERRFYEIEASASGWTLPELKRQFNSGLYERLALSRVKDGVRKLAEEGQLITRSEDLLKEPYAMGSSDSMKRRSTPNRTSSPPSSASSSIFCWSWARASRFSALKNRFFMFSSDSAHAFINRSLI